METWRMRGKKVGEYFLSTLFYINSVYTSTLVASWVKSKNDEDSEASSAQQQEKKGNA